MLVESARKTWKFRKTSDEATAREWVRLKFGEEAASNVMGLSQELRDSLYGDVLHWGPAGDEIAAFVVAVNAALVDGWAGRLDSRLTGLAGSFGNKYGSVVGFIGRGLVGKPYSVYDGVTVVMAVLNGQYVFMAEDVAGEGELVGQVNAVLEILRLPALSGVFAGVTAS